jgi:hypothetical protein
MKILTLILILYSTMLSAQDTTLTGNNINITLDKSVKGYKFRKIDGSRRDTIRVSKEVFNNINTKLSTGGRSSNPVGFQLIVDQDAFIKKFNEDRDYTMGLQATWTWERHSDKFVRKLFQLADSILIDKSHYFTFSFSGFTPYHLEYDYVDNTDRPYAALMSFSKSSTYNFDPKKFLIKNLSRGHFFRSSTLIGFMGKGTSSAAKFIQTAIHSGQRSVAEDKMGVRPDPLGWEYAIAREAKLPVVVNYYADYANEFEMLIATPRSIIAPLKLLVKPTAGIAAGTLYDYGTVGSQFQFGFYNSNFWKGNNDGSIFDVIDDIKPKSAIEFSLTGEYFLQYWLHNATLNGILFNRNSDIYHLSYDQMERITNFYGLGGELSYKRKISLGYSKYVRSAVMKGLDRKQIFGRVLLRINI